MSEYVEDTPVATEAPVASEEPITAEETITEESVAEAPVTGEAEVEEVSVASAEEPITAEAPVTEAVEVEEGSVSSAEEPVVTGEPTVEENEPDVSDVGSDNEVEETIAVEKVASDIRDILSTESEGLSSSSGLSDDLKLRIAELDYLRECCGKWIESGIEGRGEFLNAWTNKNVIVDPNIDYVNILLELEKMPEIVELLSKGEITTKSNHFKNIKSYTLDKHVFNEKTNLEKVNILEQLVKSLDFEKKNLSATYNVDILGV